MVQDLGRDGGVVAVRSTYNRRRYLVLATDPATVVDMHHYSKVVGPGELKQLRKFTLYPGFLDSVIRD
jgi:hypothetical protein